MSLLRAALLLSLLASAACGKFEAGEGDAPSSTTARADAGCSTDPPGVILCTEAELEANTQTGLDDARESRLPTSNDQAPYLPNCMVIRAGQTVTWKGRIQDHPLEPLPGGSPENPIPSISRAVTSVPVTFGCPGDFNFGCGKHEGAMSGTIRVLP